MAKKTPTHTIKVWLVHDAKKRPKRASDCYIFSSRKIAASYRAPWEVLKRATITVES